MIKLSHQNQIIKKELALKRQLPLFEAMNYQKQQVKVARMYEKMTNARTDYLHKISTNIIK